MKLRKTQLSYRLKKMNGNVRKDGKIWNTGVALLKYFAGLNSNQNGQYGQIYAEKFTSACLISIGEMRMLVQLVRDGDLKMERAAEKAKMTVEQFKKVMENTPLQAV